MEKSLLGLLGPNKPEDQKTSETKKEAETVEEEMVRICAAQVRSLTGDIEGNVARHVEFVTAAVELGADVVLFPELSLTGYEPKLAQLLASHEPLADERFDVFQRLSDQRGVVIVVGMPTWRQSSNDEKMEEEKERGDSRVLISMIVFQPRLPRSIYSKQHLHSDEFPYFVEGSRDSSMVLTVLDEDRQEEHRVRLVPAICYESMLPEHSEHAATKLRADVYLASVAKSRAGVEKGTKHFSETSKRLSMTILMVNCVGRCDGDQFDCVGGSAVWDTSGQLVAQLPLMDSLDSSSVSMGESLMVFDLNRGKATMKEVPLQ